MSSQEKAQSKPSAKPVSPRKCDRDDRYRIGDFLSSFTAFDVMPDSSRIIVVDSEISTHRAWRVLDEHRCTAAVIWDAAAGCYTGLFSSSDVMQLLLSADATVADTEVSDIMELLFHTTLTEWGEMRRLAYTSSAPQKRSMCSPPVYTQGVDLFYVTPDTPLRSAIRQMLALSVHRLPVINEFHSVTHLLTYRNICRFLVSNYRMPTNVLNLPVVDLGLCPPGPVLTIGRETSLRTAIELLMINRLSAVPVVDSEGRCINIFGKEDVVNLIRWRRAGLSLDLPIRVILENRPADTEVLYTMPLEVKLGEVLKFIAERRVHRVVLLDSNDKVAVVVSLRYILSFLSEDVDASESLEAQEV